MRILRAQHAGACYGVKRAVSLARAAAERGGEVHTLGPLIHNPQVVDDLARSGVLVAEDADEVDGGTVVIRSHGVDPRTKRDLEEKGLSIVDATCPHVARAQEAASELARGGRLVLVVGDERHPEVEGLRAYAQAAGGKVVVVGDSKHVPDELPARVGVVVQTTQRRAVLDKIVEVIGDRGVELDLKDTICAATSLRQEAAAALAVTVDAMIVVGGRNSSNTTRLLEICRNLCPNSHQVESAIEIDPSWLRGCETVGLTAGASTPDSQIEEVERFLESL